ncbi:MAG: ABC transporter permease [Dehalococcoidia bacterium]|nr:MAG: ABC transporter permease [Dehalococcoidia bacterium]
MTALIAIEFTKIVHRRLNQITFAVTLALLVVIYVLLWMTSDVITEAGVGGTAGTTLRSTLYLKETVPFAMLMLYTVGFAAGIVVIGSNVGSEYGWNTVRSVTAAEPRRWRVLLAKLLALWGLVVAALILGLAVMLTTSTIITLVAGEFDLSFVDAEYLRESTYSFLRVIVATAPYFSLAVLLATVGKSATAGIALAFGVGFLEGILSGLMTLAGGWVDEIPQFFLDANADTLGVASGGQLGEMFGSGSAFGQAFERPSVPHAIVVLLCWTAVFLGGSFWAFHRQDLEYQG